MFLLHGVDVNPLCAPNDKELLNVEKAWQHLADERNVDMVALRREIALSWKRCLERQMCPISSKNEDLEACFEEYMEKYSLLYKITGSHMKHLYEGLRGKGFIVILTHR